MTRLNPKYSARIAKRYGTAGGRRFARVEFIEKASGRVIKSVDVLTRAGAREPEETRAGPIKAAALEAALAGRPSGSAVEETPRANPARRRRNPTRRDALTFEQAVRRFMQFTGEEPLEVTPFELEVEPEQYAWLLGRVVEVAYEIPRFDGERRVVAVHKFRARSRPFLAATPEQLFIVGGAYEVTDHGIEDR